MHKQLLDERRHHQLLTGCPLKQLVGQIARQPREPFVALDRVRLKGNQSAGPCQLRAYGAIGTTEGARVKSRFRRRAALGNDRLARRDEQQSVLAQLARRRIVRMPAHASPE